MLGTLIRSTDLRVLQGSIALIALVVGILSWMELARLVRATFLSLKEKEFVEAARAAGSGNARIMLRHVLPGAVGPIVVQASLLVAATIITESGLSYLGNGVQPPTATWGNLLRDAQPPHAANPGLRHRPRHDDLPYGDEHQLRRQRLAGCTRSIRAKVRRVG